MKSSAESARLLNAGVAVAQTIVFATLPFVKTIVSAASNLPLYPNVGRALVFVSIATILVLAAARVFGGSLQARAAWLSSALILLSGYSTILLLLRPSDSELVGQHPWVAVSYSVVAFALALLVRRPWDRSPRHTPALTILAVVLLAQATLPFAWDRAKPGNRRWQQVADTLIATAGKTVGVAPQPAQDVYFIVLDGFGRGDTLKELYDVDLQPFVEFLRARHFYVPERSTAAYAQTLLSLSAILNMTYLDPVAAELGRTSRNREVPAYLMAHNAMMAAAKRVGYRVRSTGSEFPGTLNFSSAESTDSPAGLNEVEQSALGMTPFGALPLEHWTRRAHGRNVLGQFRSIREAKASSPQPLFLFTHILAPHPPFVFNADGSWRPSKFQLFTLADGSHFPGTRSDYRSGYAGQVRFVIGKLMEAVDAILSRQGPGPVIVITGDHGPGSDLQWEDAATTNIRERMAIFSAYRFPNVPEGEMYPSISPVNAARVFANHYLGARLEPLPDRSSFSTWSRPFDFITFNE